MNHYRDRNTSKYLHLYLNLKKKGPNADGFPTLEQIKEEYIDYVLELASNDLEKTAQILKISPDNLFKKIRKIHLRI